MAHVDGYLLDGIISGFFSGIPARDCPPPGVVVPPSPPPPPRGATRPTGGLRGDRALGIDIFVLTDIGLRWDLVTGTRNLALALARRLSTPRGALDWDTNYGFDLRNMLSAGLTRTQLSELRGAISAECEKDPRVLRCDADVTYNAPTQVLLVNLLVTSATGPFPLILSVSALTVEILNANLPTAGA